MEITPSPDRYMAMEQNYLKIIIQSLHSPEKHHSGTL